jgi:MoaE-MoaD fusion protein
MMIRLQDSPIDPSEVEEAVSRPEAGAVLCFLGTTRNRFLDKAVLRLEYEAYEPMALAEMRRISEEIQQRWPDTEAAMVHRIGLVPIGEASVVIAVSSVHRDAAYAASRFAIDSLKERVPIWKKEIYEDGSTWKLNQ